MRPLSDFGVAEIYSWYGWTGFGYRILSCWQTADFALRQASLETTRRLVDKEEVSQR